MIEEAELPLDDNRKSDRRPFKLPVQLELIPNEGPANRIVLAHTFNISRSGVALLIPNKIDIAKKPKIIVKIDRHGAKETLHLPSEVVWMTEDQCGLRFQTELSDLGDLITHNTTRLHIQSPKVRQYFPYVGGQDIDSGEYGFFPYMDKFILQPEATKRCVLDLKRGKVPENFEQFVFANYALADSRLNHAAMAWGHQAFKAFRKFSLKARRQILDDIRRILLQEKEELIRLMIIEGHPRKLAEWEFSGMVTGCSPKSLDYFESEIFKVVNRSGAETMINIRRPEGLICVSPPGNASCSNSLTAILALLTGNTLIVKPPVNAPVSTIHLWRNVVARALDMNGAPKGTVNIVIGSSVLFTNEWLESPHVRGILLFNESEVGLGIGRRIYEKGKKPILELSGNDFMVIWKDAPLEEAADSLLDCFMGSTQICMVPKKALVHQDVYEEFLKVFLDKVSRLKYGLPSDPDTILSPVKKIADFFEHLQDALRQGAKVLAGGQQVDHLGRPDSEGAYLAPTVVEVPEEKANAAKCVREENFFPLLPLIRMKSRADGPRERDLEIYKSMLSLLENNAYGLRISAWVKDPAYLRKFIDDIHFSGLLRINSRHIAFSECLSTHGGIGRTGGPFGEMNHVWQKTSHLQGISLSELAESEEETPVRFKVIRQESRE